MRRAAVAALAAAGVAAATAAAAQGLPPVEATSVAAGGARPSLNFYGVPGGFDTPSAFALDEGDLAISFAQNGPIRHGTLTFQALPWLSGSFRYTRVDDLGLDGRDGYFDRSFDLRLRLLEERRYLPEVTLGLQDFAGTGLYSSEYLVASKRFGDRLSASVGLGWGRLGTEGEIGRTGDRPNPDVGEGGTLQTDSWFRGPVAPFASLDWRATDRVRLKLEYSSDGYLPEQGLGRFSGRANDVYDLDSPFSVGVEYQASPAVTLSAALLHGAEFGFGARVLLNPKRSAVPGILEKAPPPVRPRIDPRDAPALWSPVWAELPQAQETLGTRIAERMAEIGLVVEGFEIVSGAEVILRVRDPKVGIPAQTIGRAARVLANQLPASAELFRIVPVRDGVAVSQAIVRRSDLERFELAPDGTERLAEAIVIADASGVGGVDVSDPVAAEIYPRFDWSLGPYVVSSFFDPDKPYRFEYGVELAGEWRPLPGIVLSGAIAAPIDSNRADETLAPTGLPRVRTDTRLYGDDEPIVLQRLTVAHYGRPGPDLYSRVTAGYLERAFGGVSAELLWKPAGSRWALGADLAYARKRDYDLGFGFQDYDILTGFVSVYAELGLGLHGQLDLGRYLAGDVGATLRVSREFANGWEVGAFATFTDASAEEFGEGSFDKGISLTIPVRALLGNRTTRAISTAVRPITRDGGAQLSVEGRLYDRVRAFDGPSFARTSGRVLR